MPFPLLPKSDSEMLFRSVFMQTFLPYVKHKTILVTLDSFPVIMSQTQAMELKAWMWQHYDNVKYFAIWLYWSELGLYYKTNNSTMVVWLYQN